MPRTPVRRVGQESASLQALVPWCSSCNGLMGGRVRCTGEANYFRYYKRLGAIAKLATSYSENSLTGDWQEAPVFICRIGASLFFSRKAFPYFSFFALYTLV